MSDHMQVSKPPSQAALLEHFQIERELSDRLRNASAEERRSLYSSVYDEFHERVTYLRYLGHSDCSAAVHSGPSRGMKLVARYITPDSVFLEIGPGDCAFAREVSAHVRKVYAVDVSETAMLRSGPLPPNVEMRVTGGIDISVPPGSVDVAFASNLIEHLHPDDAFEQARNVYDALKPGGVYICITPNRMNGPHDVSGDFGEKVATGFHLKEYAYRDIIPFLRSAGFTDIRGYLDLKGRIVTPLPARIMTGFESLIEALPERLQTRAKRPLAARAMLMVRVVCRKPGYAK